MCSISTAFDPTVPSAVTPTCTQQRKLTLRGVSSSASREMVCAFALRVTIWVVMKVTLRYGSKVLRALSKIKEESRFFLERWQIAPRRRVTFTTQVFFCIFLDGGKDVSPTQVWLVTAGIGGASCESRAEVVRIGWRSGSTGCRFRSSCGGEGAPPAEPAAGSTICAIRRC